MGMTMHRMLLEMPASEMAYRVALDRIRIEERERAERMAKAARR